MMTLLMNFDLQQEVQGEHQRPDEDRGQTGTGRNTQEHRGRQEACHSGFKIERDKHYHMCIIIINNNRSIVIDIYIKYDNTQWFYVETNSVLVSYSCLNHSALAESMFLLLNIVTAARYFDR